MAPRGTLSEVVKLACKKTLFTTSMSPAMKHLLSARVKKNAMENIALELNAKKTNNALMTGNSATKENASTPALSDIVLVANFSTNHKNIGN